MKRLIALFLLFSMAAAFTSCREDMPADESDSAQAVSEAGEPSASQDKYIPDGLPEMDLQGEEITIMCEGLYSDDLYRTGLIGEVVNDAIYNRNKDVEDRLNVKITPISYTDGDNLKFKKTIESNVMAGDTSVQLYVQKVMEAVQTAAAGFYLDWNTVPYVGLDKPWWNRSAVDGLSIAGKTYVLAGDIFIRGIASTSAVLFNKKLFEDAGMAYPYDLVRSGEWTYEAFLGLIRDKNSDLNGDGSMNRDDDLYGYVTNKYTGLQHMLYTLGGHVLLKDDKDIPYIDFLTPRTVDITEKAYSLFWEMSMYVGEEGVGNIFMADRAFLLGDVIGGLEGCRDMASPIGILPCPKYDESQEEYISVVDGGAQMLCVPITNDKLDATGAVAEALASESYRSVIPAYFETATKYKYTRDDDSIEMLDIIKNAGRYDAGYILNPGRFGFAIMDLILLKNKDITSFIQKNEAKAQAELDNTIEGFLGN